MIPYTKQQRILTVGDGNLSFSLSLASQVGATHLAASTYDSLSDLAWKYPEAKTNVELLQNLGVKVFHSVDATRLQDQQWILDPFSQSPKADAPAGKVKGDSPVFDRIIFNFPHVGGSAHEDIVANRAMLKGFFESAGRLLRDDGEIHVALRRNSFYDSWRILNVAKAVGLVLAKEIPFDTARYSGYVVRRTTPAQREAPSAEGARQYMFKRKPGSKHFRTPFSSLPTAAPTAEKKAPSVKVPSAVPEVVVPPSNKQRKLMAKQKERTLGEFSEQDFMTTQFGMEFIPELDGDGSGGSGDEEGGEERQGHEENDDEEEGSGGGKKPAGDGEAGAEKAKKQSAGARLASVGISKFAPAPVIKKASKGISTLFSEDRKPGGTGKDKGKDKGKGKGQGKSKGNNAKGNNAKGNNAKVGSKGQGKFGARGGGKKGGKASAPGKPSIKKKAGSGGKINKGKGPKKFKK